MKRLFVFLAIIMYSFLTLNAQDSVVTSGQSNNVAEVSSDHVEMAETLRKEGKIYVVVAVISVILLGMFFYLFALDRKIGKIEKEIRK